jgi:IclR family acetate operon transcriptional repressor
MLGRMSAGEVQSVVRAAALLGCFVDTRSGLTLTELARATELTVSTTHRLLGTLCAQGLLCRDVTGERYLPGPRLVRLARAPLVVAAAADAEAILGALAERTRETARLGVLIGDEVEVRLVVLSPEPLRLHASAGERLPAARSALGRALLAHRGKPDDVARSIPLPPAVAVDALASAAELATDLRATQFRGYALLDEEDAVGVRSIAAPVPAAAGAPQVAVEILGPLARIGDADIERLARAVQDAARALAGTTPG